MVIAIEIITSRSSGPQRPRTGRLFGNHSAGVVRLDDLVASNYCFVCRSTSDNLVYYRDYPPILLIHINNSKIMIFILLRSRVNDAVGRDNFSIGERDKKRTFRDLKFGRMQLSVGRQAVHRIESFQTKISRGQNLVIYCIGIWLT